MKPLYEFQLPAFTGFVRPHGHYHGVVITHDTAERTLTRLGRCFLNLEHYEARGRQGLFVPRDACTHSHTVYDDGIAIHFAPTDEWPVRSTLRYQFSPPDRIDVNYHFEFEQELPAFEAFIASYLPPGTLPPFVKVGGKWVRLTIQHDPREQLFLPRDPAAAGVIHDGRWEVLLQRGYSYRLTEHVYDLPVMVAAFQEGFKSPVLIQMVDRRGCLALSPNVFAPAHDFSLGGIDVSPGQVISTHSRMVYCCVSGFAEVESLYKQFCTDTDESKPP